MEDPAVPNNRIVLLKLQILTLLVIFLPHIASAQTSVPRFEVGPLFTCMRRSFDTSCSRGVGGRGTYNVTKLFAVEFQGSHIDDFIFGSGATYASGHLKATLRMEERFKVNAFGIFGPGFITFDRSVGKAPFAVSEKHFQAAAFNFGGGFEIVPTRWISARFDFTDFASETQCLDPFCDQTATEHRFDFKVGAMFRFR
jgi:hypothetical protein